MADAPKEKQKKRRSEVKKNDLPAKSKGTSSEDTKEKPESRKSSMTAQSSQRKVSGTPETVPEAPRKTSVMSESTSAPVPGPKAESSQRKVSGTPETVPEAPRKTSVMPESALAPVPVMEVESVEEKSVVNSKPIPKAVEITQTPEPSKVKSKATVEQPERRASYIAPKAATKRDVDLLYELDEQKLLELREAFHLFDLNNDGFIDKEDLRNTYITLGKTDIDDNEIQHMLSEAINPLDFDSFVVLLGYKTVELDPEEVLLEALSQWDYDDSGLISEERIKHDLMMWGDRFTPEEVEVALEDAPVFMRQNTPMIDYFKFCKILCGLRKKPKMPQPGN